MRGPFSRTLPCRQSSRTADVVIAGAGIAGIATAYRLVERGITNIVLVDPYPPLTVTSDKSSECYRNAFAGPDNTMIQFMNHSIDLLEDLSRSSDNFFHMSRRGYAYFTANPATADRFVERAKLAGEQGAGEVRIHETVETYEGGEGHGVDVVLGTDAVRTLFPSLNPSACAMLHARRAGWLSAQQLGMLLLERVRAAGLRLERGSVSGVELSGEGRLCGVRLEDGAALHSGSLVLAPGPFLPALLRRLTRIHAPLYNELHCKLAVRGVGPAVPGLEAMPMVIWADPLPALWDDDHALALAADPDPALRWAASRTGGGLHFRPIAGGLVALWECLFADSPAPTPSPTLAFPPPTTDLLLRALRTLLPSLPDSLPRSALYLDGGLYCKTPENMPLVGPLAFPGLFLCGALGGYGIMASQAAADLTADYITGAPLPSWAHALRAERVLEAGYGEGARDLYQIG